MSDKFDFYNRPMQEFGTQTLMSDFIKNLLANTPLPICKTVRIGDTLIKDNVYIYNHNLIMCTKNGVLGAEDIDPLYPKTNLYPSQDLFPSDGISGAKYEIISRYEFGKHYNNITHTHFSQFEYYSPSDHYWLGVYLRCIRDIYGVNYLPFYNCFNTQNPANINEYYTTNKYLYVTPIEFNTVYTMSYELDNSVKIRPILYSTYPITELPNNKESNKAFGEFAILSKPKNLSGRHYSNYYKFSYNTNNLELHKLEQYLYLLIQSDEPIQSLSIVEGNYHNTNYVVTGTTDDAELMNDESLQQNPTLYSPPDQKVFEATSKLRLLNSENRKNHYAFSNRLVEGLLHHTINCQDEIPQDIGRVQEKLKLKVDNIWTTQIQQSAFSDYMATQVNQEGYYNYLDINGNIDKDIEYYLFGNNISAK